MKGSRICTLVLLAVSAMCACATNGAGAAPPARAANELRAHAATPPSAAAHHADHRPNPDPTSRGMAISNRAVADHPFLAEMYADDYFPTALVDKGKAILLRLCERIERAAQRHGRAVRADSRRDGRVQPLG